MSEGVSATLDVEVSADSDMDELAREVATLARRHELTVIPAVPAVTGASLVVALSAVSVPAELFVRAAAAVGSRLLYARRHAFAVDRVAEFAALSAEQPEGEAHVRRLRDTALQHEGRTSALTVAFVAEGVLHRWTARADWYERLLSAIRQTSTRDVSGADATPPRANTGRSWSAQEEAHLVERFEDGTDLRTLAEDFGRTTGAIRSRLRRLRLLDG